LVVVSILLSNCAGITPGGTDEVATAERAKRRKVEKALKKQTAAYKDLEGRMARLQLRLLGKETQIKELSERQALLQERLDEAFQEVVRAKAKLRSLESKAEAASNIAEAEVALKALKTRAAGQDKGPGVIQAEYLLKMSVQELKKQNYGGALFLASQAKSLIKMGQQRLVSRGKIPVMAGEVPFALPVPFKVLRKSNLRQGPGSDFKVLFTLKKGASVIGHSYKDQWVRVKSMDGRSGWIFHTLLDGR
jgi:hypothetical protein